VYFTVQHSSHGWVLAEQGKPVYIYAGDSKGKAATCTGGCATAWPAVMAQNPQPSNADNLPASLGQINGQATWQGYPLYTHAGGSDLAVYPSSMWKLISLPSSDIKTGA
jgi:predicted lipoprotein with Yx(FWY)xxD motif